MVTIAVIFFLWFFFFKPKLAKKIFYFIFKDLFSKGVIIIVKLERNFLAEFFSFEDFLLKQFYCFNARDGPSLKSQLDEIKACVFAFFTGFFI